MSIFIFCVLLGLIVTIPMALYFYVRWQTRDDELYSGDATADWTTASIAEPEGALRIERDR